MATGIAWPSDKGKKFQNPTGAKQGTSRVWDLAPSHTLSVTGSFDDAVADAYDSIDQGLRILPPSLFPDFLEDERFIVWMRVAGCVVHWLFVRLRRR